LDQNDINPRLIPAAQDRGAEVLQQEVRALVASNDDSNSESESAGQLVQEVFLEESTSTRVVADATTDPAITNEPDNGSSNPIAPVFTPEVAASAETLTQKQLVWGRYGAGVADLERITLPLAEARTDRTVSVGNFDYGLFRFEDETQRLAQGLGVVGFDLRSAQASYTDASGVSALTVLGGNLDIDFQLSLFATELNLQHGEVGQIDFTASGTLSGAGYFNARADDQRIFGAVSLDGAEAGYFFERQLEGASIQGLTLWDSP
jgi:hypothetical protein